MDQLAIPLTQELLVPSLADIQPDAGMSFGPGFMEHRPEIAAKVAINIGLFSDIEFQQGILLHRLIGTDADTAFSLYTKLRGTSQNGVMLEFAKKKMVREPFATFQKITKAIKARSDERNKVAHWLWGKSDQLPDALLLVAPVNWYRPMAYFIDTPFEAQEHSQQRLDNADVLVYRHEELARLQERAEATHTMLYQFNGILLRKDPADLSEGCAELEARFGLATLAGPSK
jgi:hypothetical protein